MPCYYFQLRTANQPSRLPIERRELPDLRAAMLEAQRAARALIHHHPRRAPESVRGCLDVQDEQHRPVARIMLADIAHQIS